MLSSTQFLPVSLMSLTLFGGAGIAWADPVEVIQTTEITPVSASGIQFSSEVPEDQQQELAQDLAELPTVPVTRPDSKLLSIMGISDASPNSLLSWLTERVHFIVDENYSIEPQRISDGYLFPDSDVLPVQYGGIDMTNDEAKSDILMGNLGGSYYIIAKQNSLLVSVYVPSVGDVTLSSPRVGILKIGSGLFDESALGASRDPNYKNARRTLQLGVLFHEARHSDGHAAHLGFLHMVCPEGHAFAGLPACDANLNGPYSVEAHLVNSIDRSCEQCSLREHEILKMNALDAASRVQKEIVDPNKDPVAIVKRTQLLSSLCDSVFDMELQNFIQDDLAKDCASLPKLKVISDQIKQGAYKVPVIPSTDWDPTPEGKFDPKTDIR